MTEFDSIFKRQSIRKYEDRPVEEDVLQTIKKYIETIEPLIPGIEVKMTIVDRTLFNKIAKGKFIVSAPHYIVITSEEKEGSYLNAGYMGEQAVLHLTKLGIGSCWLGGAREQKDINYTLPYTIAIAFGYGRESIERENLEGINRKEISSWASGETASFYSLLLECVRIAPSAMNNQPWICQVSNDKIRWFKKKSNIFKKIFLENLNDVDMGIAFCHFVIAAEAENRLVTFEKEDLIHGIGYVLTAYIKDNLI
ncbi:hypothetical protein AZF37_01930 [endosymbiont 'TC1' of Trimyema compressum]|uniref:nitroreductase family protein n=1 Tax=endosymbiont 'TC1' of Trimyema compressum TaxID=243899 RepID=UPI0007F0CDCC|nr:nitroreductase family protein [endosymbiont 'TC1' of Trimyema compressum]AMP20101.1 hypothetical protein AZF37_01930 [endosymbiont 'TC1' of Trimyema compressum]